MRTVRRCSQRSNACAPMPAGSLRNYHRFQTGTAIKGAFADFCQPERQIKLFQADTAGKAVLRYDGKPQRDLHKPQLFAVHKCTGAEANAGIRHDDFFQSAAAECAFPDCAHMLRQDNLSQSLTVDAQLFRQFRQRIRQIQGCQSFAARKHAAPQHMNGIRQLTARQFRTAGKGILLDFRQSAAATHFMQARALGKRCRTDALQPPAGVK